MSAPKVLQVRHIGKTIVVNIGLQCPIHDKCPFCSAIRGENDDERDSFSDQENGSRRKRYCFSHGSDFFKRSLCCSIKEGVFLVTLLECINFCGE